MNTAQPLRAAERSPASRKTSGGTANPATDHDPAERSRTRLCAPFKSRPGSLAMAQSWVFWSRCAAASCCWRLTDGRAGDQAALPLGL